MSLSSFFNPQSLAVVGVSEENTKLGSVIFQNIIEANFSGQLYGVNPKLAGQKKQGYDCFSSIAEIPVELDMVVIVVPGKFVEAVVDDCVENKSKNVVIISAGFSEIGNVDLEQSMEKKCKDNGINLLGPNCLGTIFPYSGLNASFADGYPEKGKICFVSQSGAFCTAMLDWAAEKEIGFSHFISLGNKSDVSEVEILEHLADDDNVEIFAFYLESLSNGKRFLDLIKKISPKKPIIILEPGKSEKAAEAASSHTGSLAPNSRILEMAYQQSGAIQVFSMRAMFGLLETLTFNPHKNIGKNLAVITNAGGVGVLTTDLTESAHLKLAQFEEKTLNQLAQSLPLEANTKNPVDIIGDAKADRYRTALEIVIKDDSVDQILVLLTPQRTTEVEETAKVIGEINQKTDKNIVASFIGGTRTHLGLPILAQYNIPHFEFPVDATKVLGLLNVNHQDKANQKTPVLESKRNKTIVKEILKAKSQDFPSLPQDLVNQILESYDFDFPKNCGYNDKDLGLECAQRFFPNPVVMKISAPGALHKTDVKGVILNVDTEEKFQEAWKALQHSIKVAQFKEAHIQVQEQVPQGTEVIMGVTKDPNFGHTMLFGSGGIYTEVYRDTAVRVLPCENLDAMIDETRIGKILKGVRGESPKAIEPLIEVMKKMQQLVLDYPEIVSIDANPVMVTDDRAVCVDFKILI